MIKFSISLVIPIYNEAEIIENTLNIFNNILMDICIDYEIIAINDGSTDKTDEILNNLSCLNPHIKVFHNKTNIGSGASLWRGFQEASKELIVSNFADRPFNLSSLKEIILPVNFDKTDFIVVTRTDRSANSFYRQLTSKVNYFLIKSLFQLDISDFQFVQIYKNSILQNIKIISTETFVPPELMIKLVSKGYKFQQRCYPFERRLGGKSKCGHPIKIIKSITEILKFWFRWKILKKTD